MKVLVTGASGQLGAYLLRELVGRGLPVVAWSGSCGGQREGVALEAVDLGNAAAIRGAFDRVRPAAVIHGGALARVDECFRDPDRALAVNARGTAVLAELTHSANARLVYVSTDLVFDGELAPYREHDPAAPLSAYGRSKAAGEEAARRNPNSVVARVSLMFGPSRCGRPGFFDQQVASLRERRPITLFADEWRTPLALHTAARALAAVALAEVVGTLHIGGPERMSRFEMGVRLAQHLGLDPSLIVSSHRAAAGFAEPRPRDVSLDSSRWRDLFPQEPWPPFDEAARPMFASDQTKESMQAV
jgi:dTDP-4-dehydrorhamnose reductase